MKKKISMRKRYQLAALCLTRLLSACSGGSKTQEIKDKKPKVKLASVTTRPVGVYTHSDIIKTNG